MVNKNVYIGLFILTLLGSVLIMASLNKKGKETLETSVLHKHTNRLIDETSPYLLQHAHNPVDWFGWSDEAFELAGKQDKPVFLSIGYSTCHWCHVMEHESFSDEHIAEIMNKHFISASTTSAQNQTPAVPILLIK